MSLGYPHLKWSLKKQDFGFRQNLQTNLNTEQAEKNNEESLDFSEKVLYVGSLNPAVSEGRFKQRIIKRFCALYKANFARK